MWVLNKDIQIDSDGKLISTEASGYVWLTDSHLPEAKILASDVLPIIKTPLSSHSLLKLVNLLKCCKQNALSGILTVAGALMAFYYEKVVALWSGCPVVVACGPPETGKSTAIVMALAMMGIEISSKYVSGSTAFFMQRCGASTLPFGIDDPPKQNSRSNLNLADMVVGIFNGANMRSNIKPISSPIFASNFDLSSEGR